MPMPKRPKKVVANGDKATRKVRVAKPPATWSMKDEVEKVIRANKPKAPVPPKPPPVMDNVIVDDK